MTEEYQSWEQKVEEKYLVPNTNEFYDFGKATYGTIISMFRIPTTIRKTLRGQNIANPINSQSFKGKGLGMILGAASGIIFHVSQFRGEGILDNDVFGGAMIAGNVLSAAYEISGIVKERKKAELESRAQSGEQIK